MQALAGKPQRLKYGSGSLVFVVYQIWQSSCNSDDSTQSKSPSLDFLLLMARIGGAAAWPEHSFESEAVVAAHVISAVGCCRHVCKSLLWTLLMLVILQCNAFMLYACSNKC